MPEEVLPKLTLSECHLNQAAPDQLMVLSQQLVESDRRADGACLGASAGKVFACKGKMRESEEAFLKAFALDPSNQEAAGGLVTAVTSARKHCEEVEDRCEELRNRCSELEKKCLASEEGRKTLEAQCQTLQSRCAYFELNILQPRFMWNLSIFDFTSFTRGHAQCCEPVVISAGVTTSLELYPRGHSDSPVGLPRSSSGWTRPPR